MREVGRSALIGSMTTAGGSLVAFALRFVLNAHLARVIAPESFGIYAQASVYAALLSILQSVSFPQALVQLPDHHDAGRLAATVRRMTAWSSAALVLVGLALWPLVDLWDGPDVARCFLVLVVVNGLATYGSTFELELQRHHRWHAAAGLKLGANLVAMGLVIPVAHLTLDPLALVLRDALAPVIVMAVVVVVRWRRGVRSGRFDPAIAREVWTLGRALFWNRTLEIVLHKIDSALVGALLGQRTLGFYDQARYLAGLPNAALAPVTVNVGLRLMASLADDQARLRRAFALLQWGIARVVFVFALGALVAPELAVRIVYGPAWLEAAPLVQALAIWCALYPISVVHTILLTARSDWRPIRLGFIAAIGVSAVVMPLFAWPLDAVGVALAHTLAIGVELAIRARASAPHLGLAPGDHLRAAWPLGVALVLGLGAGLGVQAFIAPGYAAEAAGLGLALVVAVGALIMLEGRRSLAELRYVRDLLKRPRPPPTA